MGEFAQIPRNMALLIAVLSLVFLYQADSQSVCKDTIGSCQVYKSYGYCDSYKDYMRRYCTKTCGHCTVAPTTAPPAGTCKDDNTKCPTWKQYCVKTSVYWPYMSKNCKKTCKICTDGGSGGGGSNGKKEFKCSFEGNFCDWSNQPLDDAGDWAVGTVSGGPSSGADGTSSYAYVDTSNSGYKARLRMPWELVLPSSRTYIGSMCLHFRFMTGNGSLKFIEVIYPTLNNKNPRPQDKGTFSGSGSWVNGKVQVQVDNKRMLVIEGNPGSSGKVVLDEIAFVKGRC